MLSTTLFLGREGLRLALVRQAPGSSDDIESRQILVNLAWISMPIGVVLAVVVAFVYLYMSPDESMDRKYTALLYCAGGAAEVGAPVLEPISIHTQKSVLICFLFHVS